MGKSMLILVVFIVLPFLTTCQTIYGTNGLLSIPSAEMKADGTFIMGGNLLPAINQPSWGYNTGNYYFNLTFLPFLEVAYVCTLLKIANSGHFTNQDRAVSIRLQLFREKRYMPSITFGFHDLYSSVENGNQYFRATYLVLTKHFGVCRAKLGLTFGFCPNMRKYSPLRGPFGGLSLTPTRFDSISLLAEYDGNGINLGARLLLFKHLYLFSMVQHLKFFTGGVAFHVYL